MMWSVCFWVGDDVRYRYVPRGELEAAVDRLAALRAHSITVHLQDMRELARLYRTRRVLVSR